MITAILILIAQPVTISCKLRTQGNDPPMLITLNDDTRTVQVTMAGQTYLEDTVSDGTLTFWQVGIGDEAIRSRLNRADGTLIITNNGMMVEGFCAVAKRKF